MAATTYLGQATAWFLQIETIFSITSFPFQQTIYSTKHTL